MCSVRTQGDPTATERNSYDDEREQNRGALGEPAAAMHRAGGLIVTSARPLILHTNRCASIGLSLRSHTSRRDSHPEDDGE